MRLPVSFLAISRIEPARHGSGLIGIGLAIQIAATWWPAAPVVTAMSLVALGATALTIARVCRHWAAAFVLALHLTIYVGLYLLFVGALCHAATAGPRPGWHSWQMLDLGLSIWPMALALRWALAAILSSTSGEDATTR